MKTFRRIFAPFALSLALVCSGEIRAADPAVRELRIDPATTGVPLGKAKLSVDPLVHGEGKGAEGLQGHYKVEVSPLSFASEEGNLTIAVNNETLRKLANGNPVDFSGQAVSNNGNNSAVQGTATPAKDNTQVGSIRVRIDSRKGKLVFKTTYHLTK